MSTPFKVKLVIYQGSTFRKEWQLKTGAPAMPVDFTGFSARLQVRSEIESSEVLLELTTENGGITLGGTSGSIDLFCSATDTAAIDWDAGVYDLELVAPGIDGDVTRRVEGSVSVSREVTRG